jgi:hypothetical protein
MNRLNREQRAGIFQMLCEGMAIRAVESTTGVAKRTIINPLNDAGAALGAYQDQAFRRLQCARVQVDF